ncbi:MAG: helix-turn-helix domain-containing protein [Actinobacteria bacterium]|nr:helix-turn-helix domain-containing protein [Actinomycetota bacterium]
MTTKIMSYLQALGNSDRVRILAYLAKHEGETAEHISSQLNYPKATIYKYLRELENVKLIRSEQKNRIKQYSIIPFAIKISHETLDEAVYEAEPPYLQVVSERYGGEKLNEIRQLAKDLKSGKTTSTLRQTASKIGMEYYELMIALDELGIL